MVARTTVKRFKHTQPPPDNICLGCWWEKKFKNLEKAHKQVRIELFKVVNNKRKARQASMAPPPNNFDDDDNDSGPSSDPDVMDLVDVFMRGRDD